MNHLELYVGHNGLEKIKGCDDVYLKSVVLVRMLFLRNESKSIHLKHLLAVSNRMTTLDGMIAGLLHDIVYSLPNISFDDLSDIGIPDHIIDALKIDYNALKATHLNTNNRFNISKEIDDYFLEIDKVIASQNNLALELMIADISDNYKADNLKSLSIKELYLVNEKYAKNLINLRKTMEKRKEKC